MKDPGQSKSASGVNVGLVTTLNEEDLPVVQKAMASEPPPITVAGLLPPGDFMEEIGTRLPKGVPFEYILQRVCGQASMHPRFTLCDIHKQSQNARIIE